jgi:hypothetical protein
MSHHAEMEALAALSRDAQMPRLVAYVDARFRDYRLWRWDSVRSTLRVGGVSLGTGADNFSRCVPSAGLGARDNSTGMLRARHTRLDSVRI